MLQPTEDIANFVKGRATMLKNIWLQDNTNPLTMIKVSFFKNCYEKLTEFLYFQKVETMSKIFSSQCKRVLSETDIIEKLKAENYDLAITEPFDTCAYGWLLIFTIQENYCFKETL